MLRIRLAELLSDNKALLKLALRIAVQVLAGLVKIVILVDLQVVWFDILIKNTYAKVKLEILLVK